MENIEVNNIEYGIILKESASKEMHVIMVSLGEDFEDQTIVN